MTAKSSNTPADAQLVAFVGAKNAADAARVIGKPGKSFRDSLRRAGHYESKGTGWTSMDADTRATFYPAPVAVDAE